MHLENRVAAYMAFVQSVADGNLTARLGLDEETYQEVVGAFSEMVQDKISCLEKQMEGGGRPEAGMALAELHENAIYFGAERLKALVENLSERQTRIGTEKEDSEQLLLLKELRLVHSALERHRSKESKAPHKPKPKRHRSSKKSKKPTRKQ